MTGGYHGKPDKALASTVSGVGRHATEVSGAAAASADTQRPGPSLRHAVDRSRSVRGWFIATVASVAGIAGLSLWIGPGPMVAPWDDFTLLNGAYRIYEGQAPSFDFSNPIGPLVYGLTALGMHLQHAPSLAAVTYGQLIFLAIASVLAWTVAERRLPAPYAAAFTVFVAFLSVSVRPLGYAPWTTSYAMLYNRDAWLLYSTLLLLVLVRRPAPAAKHARVVDGFLLGLMLGLLFYDKITFFLASVVAVGLGLALSTLPRSPRLGAAGLGGLAVVGVTIGVLFGVRPTAYISDLLEAAKVQGASQRAGMLAHVVIWVAPVALVSVLLVGGLLVAIRRRSEPIRGIAYLSVAAAYILGSSILLSAGDAGERGELPALVVIPLLLVAFLEPRLPWWAGGPAANRAGTWHLPGSRLVLTGLALLLVFTAGRIAGEDTLGLSKAISDRSYDASPPATQKFNATPLQDFVIPADAQWQTAYRVAHAVPAMINNGLSLLRHNIRPGDTVFTLAYTDPFSMALGLPLSHCGPLWWDLGFDFDQTHYPAARCAIGDADWVIIPRMVPGQGVSQETVAVMRSLYSGYLSEHYRQVQETSDWILLRRTS